MKVLLILAAAIAVLAASPALAAPRQQVGLGTL